MRDLNGTNSSLLRRTSVAILIFVVLDVISILLSLSHAGGAIESRFFRIGRERGFGEILQYVKQIWVVVMLVRFSRLRPSTISNRWIALFCTILLDDAVGIHEEIGALVYRVAPAIGSMAAGEALSLILLEGSLLMLVLQGTRTVEGPWRIVTVRLLLALAPLFLFGGVVDALVTAPFIEEAGEALAFTLLFGTVHWSGPLFESCGV